MHACLPSWGLGPEGLLRWPRPVLSRLPCPADIYDKVSGDMQKKGYSCECLGGGRISHQSQDKKIHVYGYSMVSPCPGQEERPALRSPHTL